MADWQALSRITIDGLELEARTLGPPPAEKATIVLLHEGLGSVTTWGRFPERLHEATGLGVLAFSRRGYGGSDPCPPPWPVSYMHAEALQVLPRVLDAAGFRRGVLLGHSDGASIATLYAGGIEDHRVRGVILIAPHFFTEASGIEAIRRTVEAYATTDLRARLARHHGANVDDAFKGWSGAWLHPDFAAWDIRDSLPQIRVPMLVLQGTDDQYGTIAQVETATREAMCPVETALLPGCGHAPHLEAPQPCLEHIASFLEHLWALDGPV